MKQIFSSTKPEPPRESLTLAKLEAMFETLKAPLPLIGGITRVRYAEDQEECARHLVATLVQETASHIPPPVLSKDPYLPAGHIIAMNKEGIVLWIKPDSESSSAEGAPSKTAFIFDGSSTPRTAIFSSLPSSMGVLAMPGS